MLKESTQRVLVAYLVAMILLHAFFAIRSWRDVPIGMPDFTIFYTAGRILQLAERNHLYDIDLQREIQQEVTPASLVKRGTILPYNHPAFEALLFRPLARFGYATAYLIWLAINVLLLITIPHCLCRFLPALTTIPKFLLYLAMLAFFPIFLALLQGQDSILLLFLYCVAYLQLRQGRDALAGGILGLGLFKFHLVLPFVASLIFSGRKQLFIGFLSVMVCVVAITVWVTGRAGALAYPGFVWETEHGKNYAWGSLSNTINLRGLLYEFFPAGTWSHALSLLVFSVSFLGAAAWIWSRTRLSTAQGRMSYFDFDFPFLVSIIATILVSYHTLVHDWAILLLPVFLLSESLLSGARISQVVRYSIWVCMGALYFSPTYLMCALRYRHLEIVAYPLLFLFLLLVGCSVRIRTLRRGTHGLVATTSN
jgi:hypothetical protein